MDTNDDGHYQADLARAQADGTGFIERDDLPEGDHYHAARELADLLTGQGETLATLAPEIGLASDDPARWERLDVARAASYVRDRYPEALEPLLSRHPWLDTAAKSGAHDALDALGNSFLGS